MENGSAEDGSNLPRWPVASDETGQDVSGTPCKHRKIACHPQRIRQRYPQTIGADGRVDTHGWNFEEFGLPLNLMLAVPAPLVVGSVGDALARIAADNP